MDVYHCSTYSLTGRFNNAKCTQHHISTKVLRQLSFDAIKTVSEYAKSNETDFIRRIREESEIKQSETAKSHRRQIAKNEKRISELDNLFRKTYEDFAAGRLNEKRFEQLSGGYESEINNRQKSGSLSRVSRFFAFSYVRYSSDYPSGTPSLLA